jgi:hypothetical protein
MPDGRWRIEVASSAEHTASTIQRIFVGLLRTNEDPQDKEGCVPASESPKAQIRVVPLDKSCFFAPRVEEWLQAKLLLRPISSVDVVNLEGEEREEMSEGG